MAAALEHAANDPGLQARLARLDRNAMRGIVQRRMRSRALARMTKADRRVVRDLRLFALEQDRRVNDGELVALFLERVAACGSRMKAQRAWNAICLARVAADDGDLALLDLFALEPLTRRLGLAWQVDVPRTPVPSWLVDGALNAGRLPALSTQETIR